MDAGFAAELLERDAPALGLEGISALVREGLRLLHRRAREIAAATEYDRFYHGGLAPLPDAVRKASLPHLAVITGTEGPSGTHVPIAHDAGVTGHDVSYINATDLHTVAKPRLDRRRGLLHPAEMNRLEDVIRLHLGL